MHDVQGCSWLQLRNCDARTPTRSHKACMKLTHMLSMFLIQLSWTWANFINTQRLFAVQYALVSNCTDYP